MFMYWSAMTLVPLILLAVVYASRSALEMTKHIWGVSWVLAHAAIWVGPPIVGILILGALYRYLPNTRIPFRTAIIGAIVAAPLWMVARWGFGLYVNHAAKSNFYGALGLIPVFLIWMNLSWLIFLFGAELAYTVANLSRLESAELDENIVLGPTELLAATLAVAKPYLAGEAPVESRKFASRFNFRTSRSDESCIAFRPFVSSFRWMKRKRQNTFLPVRRIIFRCMK
jgi:membrane protein